MSAARRLWFVSIVSSAGCELVFELREPDAADAADASPPLVCPADHSAPAFAGTLTKLRDDNCFQYSESDQLAVCLDLPIPRDGLIGAPLLPATLEPEIPADGALFSAVISPDGTQLITLLSVESAPPATIEVYLREGTIWRHRSTSPSVGGASMGVPSRGPNARMLVFDPNANSALGKLIELEQQADFTWTPLRTTMPESFGDVRPTGSIMNLSPDGRQVIFKTGGTIGYAYRDSLDADFTSSTVVDATGYANAFWVVMTEHCERLIGTFLEGGVYVAPQS